jgi:hypothetical protein
MPSRAPARRANGQARPVVNRLCEAYPSETKDPMTERAILGKVLSLAFASLQAACATGSEPLEESADAGADDAAADASTDASGPVVVCDPRPPVIDPTAIIDDMEDRDGNLTVTSGRNGSWWIATDETPGGTFEPSQPLPELIPEGRCGSEYAMRVTGQGFASWGSILGLSLAYGMGGTAPHDASFRQGIRFWARIGDTSTKRIRFNIGDFHAAPDAGYCVENGTPPCFTYDVTLSQIDTTWKQYAIPFAALVHPTPDDPNEPLDPSRLYTLAFFFHSGAVFDLWVDDLEFY